MAGQIKAPKLILTAHAGNMMIERGLTKAWIEATVANPDWTAPDPREQRRRAFKTISEAQNRILRVIYTEADSEIRVITAFFDRNAKKP